MPVGVPAIGLAVRRPVRGTGGADPVPAHLGAGWSRDQRCRMVPRPAATGVRDAVGSIDLRAVMSTTTADVAVTASECAVTGLRIPDRAYQP